MMTTTDIPTKPLWRCVLRKSMSVTEKLVLYASYAINGLAAIFLISYISAIIITALLPYIYSTKDWLNVILDNSLSFVISIFVSIPWYVYVGIAVVSMIPLYSLYWCLAREITQEDRDHTNENDYAMMSELFGLLVGAVVGGHYGYMFWWGVVGAGFFGICGFGVGLFIGFYIGQNIDTYLHYRKRIKEAKQE